MSEQEKKDLIEFLRGTNPYPVEIFPEPSDKDWSEVGKLLKDNGRNPDRIFAKWGRMVYGWCIENVETFINYNDETE